MIIVVGFLLPPLPHLCLDSIKRDQLGPEAARRLAGYNKNSSFLFTSSRRLTLPEFFVCCIQPASWGPPARFQAWNLPGARSTCSLQPGACAGETTLEVRSTSVVVVKIAGTGKAGYCKCRPARACLPLSRACRSWHRPLSWTPSHASCTITHHHHHHHHYHYHHEHKQGTRLHPSCHPTVGGDYCKSQRLAGSEQLDWQYCHTCPGAKSAVRKRQPSFRWLAVARAD